jgi:pilus assembly protein CpaE
MTSSQTVRAVVAVHPGADRALVQQALPVDDLDIVGALDVYEGSWSMLGDAPADVVLVACGDEPDGVLPFIEGAVRDRPTRPVVILVSGSPNGFVRRAFAAGADDMVALDDADARADVAFTVQKAVARRHGPVSAAGNPLGSMICVLGPKGGVGKTLTSCNLAVALAAAGHRVSLVDLDVQFGDVGLVLGVPPERTLHDLAKSGGALDPEKLDAYLVTHPSGARALLAPTRPEQANAVSVELLGDVYGVLRRMSDFVIVDTPPRLAPEVIAAIDTASDACLVGMLDALALKATKLGLETLARMSFDRQRTRLVLNRADSRVGLAAGDVAAIIGRQADVLVPSHRDIAHSVNQGSPIALAQPRSGAARAFRTLADLYAKPLARRNGSKPGRRRLALSRNR